MTQRNPAEVFPPGEFLKEELEARNWTQIEFAEIIGKDARLVYEIVNGKRSITPETALVFSQALGTTPELWLNLESAYQLSKVKGATDVVQRRAFLHSTFPLREMTKRSWIRPSPNLDVIEEDLRNFFHIKSLVDNPEFPHAAKRSTNHDTTIQQLAWLFRVRSIAEATIAPSFAKSKLEAALPKLAALTTAVEEARHAPRILAECGVRLIFVEPLPGSRIDGACFWIGEKPVIGMTMRFDRIDNFWFVLRHEIEHVLRGHGRKTFFLDQDMDKQSESDEDEKIANQAAAAFCVAPSALLDFIDRVAPYFSEKKVLLFAQRIGVHPGLVVGQLQRALGRHDFLKKYQEKVRSHIVGIGITDGWGVEYPVET